MAAVVFLLLTVAYIAFLNDTKAAATLGAATLVGLVGAFTASKYFESRSDAAPVETKRELPARDAKNSGRSGGKR